MEPPETQTHSFILKVWLEETAEEAGRALWRGHITHVPSGKREYLTELDAVILFVMPYLENLGVKLGMFTRISWRLKRWKRYRQTRR